MEGNISKMLFIFNIDGHYYCLKMDLLALYVIEKDEASERLS